MLSDKSTFQEMSEEIITRCLRFRQWRHGSMHVASLCGKVVIEIEK